jgi:uncharacterized membrane protein YoaK (UPF0700 family)
MISKLPRWICIGGVVLTLSAGMVNSIAFLGFSHQAVTHLTGTTTHASIALINSDWNALKNLGMLIFSFLFGAILCGVIVKDGVLRFGKRYGFALIVESCLLFFAMRSFAIGSRYGEFFASGACGLQNAMVSTYSGAIIRTTHVTGIVTDLGMLIGQWIRGVKLDKARIRLYILLLLGFFIGSGIGAYLYVFFSYYALAVPTAITGFSGLSYLSIKFINKVKLGRIHLFQNATTWGAGKTVPAKEVYSYFFTGD